jgi:phosphoglycolate phosphatase-like HAD superfamily hydrolase
MALNVGLYDLDNTLVLTQIPYIEDVVGNTLERLGKKSTADQRLKIWFLTDPSVYAEIGTTFEEFWSELRKIDTPETRAEHTDCAPDIKALIKQKEQGYKLGIVTAARPAIAEAEIEVIRRETRKKFGTPLEFDAVIYAHVLANMRPKPYPDCLFAALDAIHAKPEQAFYAGDIPTDAVTARNAGVLDILVDRMGMLNGAKSTYRVMSLDDINDIIFSLSQRMRDPARTGQALYSQR